jgi:hypothetical protein
MILRSRASPPQRMGISARWRRFRRRRKRQHRSIRSGSTFPAAPSPSFDDGKQRRTARNGRGFNADNRTVTSFQIGLIVESGGCSALAAKHLPQSPLMPTNSRAGKFHDQARRGGKRVDRRGTNPVREGDHVRIAGKASTSRSPIAGTADRTWRRSAITDTADGRRILDRRARRHHAPDLWEKARRAGRRRAAKSLVVDAAGGVVRRCRGRIDRRFAPPPHGSDRGRKPARRSRRRCSSRSKGSATLTPNRQRRPAVDDVGFAAFRLWRDMRSQVNYRRDDGGATFAARHPASVRWRDVWASRSRWADAADRCATRSSGAILAFRRQC